jgi:glycosyltransferase involved in cell wall biosynthesis
MRLVVFGSGHPFRGGVARTTTEMVAALEKRGHDLVYLTPSRQYPAWLFPGSSDRDPGSCRRLDCAERLLQPLNPWSWPATRRRALASDAQAWIVPYWTWAWAGLWTFLLRGRRPPAVAVVHNPADHDSGYLRRQAARTVLGHCQGLFTHATALERDLEQGFPGRPTASCPFPPISVGPLPDRDGARSLLGLPPDHRTALVLGLIRPYKGVDLLLEAFADLPATSDWRLVVAGEPWAGLEHELLARIDRSGLDNRVRMELRWIPEIEVPRFLAAADLVVLPYRSGSQSAVAPMALAAGKPVLTTDVGGVSEAVRHGVDGWVVEPGSAEALRKALLELDRPTLDRLTRGAAEGCGRLTWNGYAESLEGLITMAVQGSNVHH